MAKNAISSSGRRLEIGFISSKNGINGKITPVGHGRDGAIVNKIGCRAVAVQNTEQRMNQTYSTELLFFLNNPFEFSA